VIAEPAFFAPTSVEQALALRGELGEHATVLAGGTFLGILLNQGFLTPAAFLSLGRVDALRSISVRAGSLHLGALVTHSAVERSVSVREGWPALAHAFGVVASPRVRNQATVGGVLADADYASDPPAMLAALDARVVLRSAGGERSVSVEELILGYYETCIADDELLTEVVVPPMTGPAVYRKFRSRSSEDRPCVSVAAARGEGGLKVVVGAVAEVPQSFPEACGGSAAEVAAAYAERVQPIADARGSAEYRRRVVAVEVRRAVEAL
jgi:aerobic carbon-monoxide dehydrogenase medium subunit